MQSLRTKLRAAFVTAVLLCTLPASAITQGYHLLPEDTPILLKGFYDQLKEYDEQSRSDIHDSDRPAGDVSLFAFRFIDNADVVLTEMLKIYQGPSARENDRAVMVEVERLRKDLQKRGYVPAHQTHWVRSKDLTISYDLDGTPGGPKPYPHPVNRLPVEHYTHSFKYQYQLSYQKGTAALQGGANYPVIEVSGYLFLQCKQPFAECNVENISTDRASILWQSVPGWRGGNSSGGGGNK